MGFCFVPCPQNGPDGKVMRKLPSRNKFITFLKIQLFAAAGWFKCSLNNPYSMISMKGQPKEYLQRGAWVQHHCGPKGTAQLLCSCHWAAEMTRRVNTPTFILEGETIHQGILFWSQGTSLAPALPKERWRLLSWQDISSVFLGPQPVSPAGKQAAHLHIKAEEQAKPSRPLKGSESIWEFLVLTLN